MEFFVPLILECIGPIARWRKRRPSWAIQQPDIVQRPAEFIVKSFIENVYK